MKSPCLEGNLRVCWVCAYLICLVLMGCGSPGKKEEAKPEAGAVETKPTETATSAYAVEELPSGRVEGRILLKGSPPRAQTVVVNQDPGVCGSRKQIYPVRVEKGGVTNAVVSIEGIARGKAFAFPRRVLTQKQCTFVPHIVLMQPGDLAVESLDPVPHNVHIYAQVNRAYNESMNPLRRSLTLSFARPEIVTVKCDLHGWMKAYVILASNPYYAVSGESGRFELEKVPAGRYRLKAWHETLGEIEQDIVVEAGKKTRVEFTFESKSS